MGVTIPLHAKLDIVIFAVYSWFLFFDSENGSACRKKLV